MQRSLEQPPAPGPAFTARPRPFWEDLVKGYRNGRCLTCAHPERVKIDMLLAGGAAFTAVARKFKLDKHAIARHFERHLSKERRALLVAGPMRVQELAERAHKEGLSLLDYLSLVRSTLVEQFMNCAEAGDTQGSGIISGRLLECLRIIGTVTGDLTKVTSNVTHNTLVLGSPMMAELEQMLIQRLRPFPDAARAVMTGLEELSNKALGNLPALPGPPP